VTVPTDDRGLTLGDGLFETLLAEHGRLQFWDAHLARLLAGCAALGIPAPSASDLLSAAREALERGGLEDARAAVRLTWTAGSGGRGLGRPRAPAPRLFAAAFEAPVAAPRAASLATVAVRRNEGSAASRLKTLSYLDNVLARAEAARTGADEAVMLNNRGELACAAAANLFWIEDRRLFTPALECGVLDGIMRRAVIRAAAGLGVECLEVRVQRQGFGAVPMFITNSLIGLRPVERLDGEVLPADPLVGRLAEAIEAA
jgi:branched-subunit amino acid aminotransferase/4-amino-4-deoxychorismate lyase